MGEETTQFASRYTAAVSLLERLAGDRTHAALRRELGQKLVPAAREALDALEAVFASGTEGLRRWPEQRTLALSRIAGLRAALERTGVNDEVRRRVRALLEIVESGPGGDRNP